MNYYTQQPKKKIKFDKEENDNDLNQTKPFQIFFKNIMTRTLEINSDDTIAAIKQKISEKVIKNTHLYIAIYLKIYILY